MRKCDCCGVIGLSSKETKVVSNGIQDFHVCINCFDNIQKVKSGEASGENLIAKNIDHIDSGIVRILQEIQSESSGITQGTGSSVISTLSNNSPGESGVGNAIKVLAVILIILSLIGSFALFRISIVYGIAGIMISVLIGMLCYGIGEICCRLASIEAKLKHR